MSSLVSIIIPTFNRSDCLRRAIDSALAQTHADIELIVVDDGSTDETGMILESYGKRLRWLSQSRSGPSAARNVGARLASGEFLSFLDSDDCWEPEKIEIQVNSLIRAGKQVPCCICNALILEANGDHGTSFEVASIDCSLKHGYWPKPGEVIASRFVLFNQVALIWRSTFESVGGFCEDLKLLEDHELAFRLSCLGPWAFDTRVLVKKYNETVGIGVTAMRDPLCHAIAWQHVVKRCESSGPITKRTLMSLLKKCLFEANFEVWCLRLICSRGQVEMLFGRMGLIALRLHQTLRRRRLGWSRVECSNFIGRAVGESPPKNVGQ